MSNGEPVIPSTHRDRAGPVLPLWPPPCLEWPPRTWNTGSVFCGTLSMWYFPSRGAQNSVMESKLWGNGSLSFVNALTRFPPTFLSLPQAGCAPSPSLPAPVFLLCKGKKVSGNSDWPSDVIGWEAPRRNLCVFNYLWRHKRLWSRPSMSR